ncbi:MAG: histidine phosphatase family protein [Chloroflexi bacterium]|nr:histidine phosphatase family protein [Chloroflexota bacterium]
MGNWYLVRHGETAWNRSGQIQGHTDVPLSEYGRLQVRRLAERLSTCSFSKIYTSDLSRALESAETLAKFGETSIEADSDLREFSYGTWESMTQREMEIQDPKGFAERIGGESYAFATPGGESTTQVLARVRRFHARAAERHDPSESLLIVAHGGSIRALLVCLLGLPDTYFWRLHVDNSSLSVVQNHPGGRVLERWNDTGHLTSLEPRVRE